MSTHPWQSRLPYDPIPFLLDAKNPAILYFTHRDLLEADTPPLSSLWELPEPARILRRQGEDGGWRYRGNDHGQPRRYRLLETYRQLAFLVEKYGFNKEHSAISRAAELVFSYQSEEGDLRGIYAQQYSPNYTAGLLELLSKAGFGDDYRLQLGYSWLLEMRQADGGWAIPMRTHQLSWEKAESLPEPVLPERSRPFSHWVTGVVLRALAAHPLYQSHAAAQVGGFLMLGRFGKRDKYVDRQGKEYWERVSYPFWWTDAVSTLDSLVRLGFTPEHPLMAQSLEWIAARQNPDGGFDFHGLRDKDPDHRRWIALAVSRILKRCS